MSMVVNKLFVRMTPKWKPFFFCQNKCLHCVNRDGRNVQNKYQENIDDDNSYMCEQLVLACTGTRNKHFMKYKVP